MSNSLFLKYAASDTGARPIPANTTFWESPAVVLGTSDGNYVVGQPATIDVSPSLMTPQAYEIINVQVWVCDPTTVAGPSTALPPFQGAGPNQLTLTGFFSPANPAQAISSVPTIQVSGFVPYPGISSLPGGHCCLIANCFGTQGDGTMDGVDLNTEAAANLPQLVQSDPHVAQHNIFADATPPGAKIVHFPFRAATPLRTGQERVKLTIAQVAHTRLTLPLQPHVRQLSSPRFAGLPLHVSQNTARNISLSGAPSRQANIHEVELDLTSRTSHVLTAEVELSPQDKPGAMQAFDVVQRDARGRVQGGFRLIVVAGH